MSSLSISLAEKKLLQHLQLGGDVYDQVGKELVVKFATTAMKDTSIAAIAERNRISLEDICVIYGSMIHQLMPNPCVQSGGLLLVPTLFFMEPFRFEGLATEISSRAVDLSAEERKEKMISISQQFAQEVWDTHTQGRGEAPFHVQDLGGRKSSGCASMIVMAFFLSSAIGLGLYKTMV